MNLMGHLSQHRLRIITTAFLLTALLNIGRLPGAPAAISVFRPAAAYADGGCHLNSPNGAIQHVIYVQFDNTHFTRDNPNVPSDLEQMPHLLNFLEGNGVLDSNHHTPLIAHTATDILTSLTGLYGDRQGVPIANSFRYFNPNGSSNLGVSFAYWTTPIFDPTTKTPTDQNFNMLDAAGQNTPAPWVPYTRAGCNVGAVATANTILENDQIDIPTVFGANSLQAQEVAANEPQGFADFVGLGIHCAQGNALCSTANGGVADRLPQEPYGYSGYNALFGNKYVAPQISPGGPVTDLNGNVIKDSAGHVGFPGFDGMSAATSLGYVADMQEHGVPVTYAYISDAHDNHTTGNAMGPGQADYVAQLKSYDNAFGTFFTRLAADGINKSNTMFVFTSDEGDHFVGGAPNPANCDGVTTPCTYSHIGEINGNLAGLLATEQNITTPFTVHSDSAPNFYLTGNPFQDAPVTRAFERAVGKLTALNPLTGNTDQITNYLADPVEENILHMVTADPYRTPTLTMFADPNYYLYASKPNCAATCVQEEAGSAWNHGDVSPDINTTWLGMVGPGIRNLGVDGAVWTDHTDIRPTMMALLGLKDDYRHDGRVITEFLHDSALPQTLDAHRATLEKLGAVYKQLDASVGEFGLASLKASTRALESNDPNDGTYTAIEAQLQSLGTERNDVATAISAVLEGAEFNGQALNEQQAKSLIDQAQSLITRMDNLAG